MKTIKVEEIPAELKARDFLASLDPSEGEIVFEQGGQAWFVAVPAGVLEQRRRAKEALFLLVDGLRGRNPGADSDEILKELEEVDCPEPPAS
ncbi:MAG TPA: hypothetical protein VKA46_26635 [Gemmataceae bacterium]|nr:hypothetical protein [Gemmataceae bacterium]